MVEASAASAPGSGAAGMEDSVADGGAGDFREGFALLLRSCWSGSGSNDSARARYTGCPAARGSILSGHSGSVSSSRTSRLPWISTTLTTTLAWAPVPESRVRMFAWGCSLSVPGCGGIRRIVVPSSVASGKVSVIRSMIQPVTFRRIVVPSSVASGKVSVIRSMIQPVTFSKPNPRLGIGQIFYEHHG